MSKILQTRNYNRLKIRLFHTNKQVKYLLAVKIKQHIHLSLYYLLFSYNFQYILSYQLMQGKKFGLTDISFDTEFII